jgi:hypothetical protein
MPGRNFLRVFGGNGMPPIDPVTFASLELYLRSDTIIAADGSNAATWPGNVWPDSSSHARNGAVGVHTSPVLRKTGVNLTPNGTQVVDFSGATSGLQCFMGAAPISGANGWTMLAYYKSVVLDALHANDLFDCPTGQRFEFVANSNVAFNGYDRDNRPGFDMAPVPLQRKTFDPLATTGWHMLSVTLNPPISGAGTVVGVRDGVTLTPTFTGWNCALEGNLHPGNNAGSNSNLDGTMAALLVFSQALTGLQLAGVSRFLKGVFG